jgi:hypothetical protein
MPNFVVKAVAKLKEHKIAVAVIIAVGAGVDHFLGNAVLSGLIADLLASAP